MKILVLMRLIQLYGASIEACWPMREELFGIELGRDGTNQVCSRENNREFLKREIVFEKNGLFHSMTLFGPSRSESIRDTARHHKLHIQKRLPYEGHKMPP